MHPKVRCHCARGFLKFKWSQKPRPCYPMLFTLLYILILVGWGTPHASIDADHHTRLMKNLPHLCIDLPQDGPFQIDYEAGEDC